MHHKALVMALTMIGVALVGDSQLAFAQTPPDVPPNGNLGAIIQDAVQRLLAALRSS